jgi:hypothetical protein
VKLTALEADTSRCATIFRHVVELCFAAIKQDKWINERHESLSVAEFGLDVAVENSMTKSASCHHLVLASLHSNLARISCAECSCGAVVTIL